MPKLSTEQMLARRARILDAALSCFARDGFHGTTIDDVATEAGMSKGAVYTYVASKDDLLIAVVDRFVDHLGLRSTLTAAGETPTRRLEEAVTLAFSAATSDHMLNLLSPVIMQALVESRGNPQLRQATARLYGRLREPFIAVIDEGVASGEFRQVDAATLANLLLAVFDGLMIQAMLAPSAVSWPATVTALRDTLLSGLRAAP